MSKTLFIYTLKAALRDKMVRVVSILFIIIGAMSSFLGGAAVFEAHSFTLIFAASSLRLTAVLGVILFVSFYIQRSFASKDIDFILSRPVSRETFIVSQSLAFVVISFIITIGAFLVIYVLAGFKVNFGFLCWILGLFVEVAIMANLAMFFSMILSSTVASFASTFGFYVLSRMTGAIFGTIDAEKNNMVITAMEKMMEAISVILPRFDLTIQSEWLLYGIEDNLENFYYNIVTGVLFLIFINIASIIDLKRKEF